MKKCKAMVLAVLITVGAGAQLTQARAASAETLTVAGGCFWCVESDFESVRGVSEVVSGYTGGTVTNPTYKQVTRGGTGHYEAVQIRYDPGQISARQLLDLFFRSIDPTDSGGQFCDRGNSYRTAVFTASPAQKKAAEAAKSAAMQALGRQIVTPVLDAGPFYEAEAYHQDYYKGNSLVLTRFGPKRQSEAYTAYRKACRRDERVKQLWGDAAPFVGKH